MSYQKEDKAFFMEACVANQAGDVMRSCINTVRQGPNYNQDLGQCFVNGWMQGVNQCAQELNQKDQQDASACAQLRASIEYFCPAPSPIPPAPQPVPPVPSGPTGPNRVRAVVRR